MPFDFTLAAVLRYRESIEQREFLILERLQQEIALLEVKVRRAEEECSAAEQSRRIELAKGMCAAELRHAYEYQGALEQHRKIMQSQLPEAKLKWQRQLLTYQKARRRRQILEELRTRQHDVYRQEQAKREQNRIDDLFLARRGHQERH